MFRPFVLLITAAGLFLQSGCGGSDLVNATEVSDNQTPDISDSVQSGQQHLAPVITKIYPGSQFSNPEPAIQERLDKLDIGYVDIMLLHHPGTNDVKAYKAMEKFLSEGKIKSLGLSCFYVKELSDFLPKVSVKPVLVQNEIHPYYQDTEVVDFIHKNNIVVQAWYPLGGRGFQKELLNDPVLADIAKAHGKSIVQVILRWHWQRNVVAIPGSSNPAHIAENHDIFDFELSAEEMGRIASLDRNEKHDWY